MQPPRPWNPAKAKRAVDLLVRPLSPSTGGPLPSRARRRVVDNLRTDRRGVTRRQPQRATNRTATRGVSTQCPVVRRRRPSSTAPGLADRNDTEHLHPFAAARRLHNEPGMRGDSSSSTSASLLESPDLRPSARDVPTRGRDMGFLGAFSAALPPGAY